MDKKIFEACERKQEKNKNGESAPTWDELADVFDIPSGKILKDRFYRAKNRRKYTDNPDGYVPEKDEPAPQYKETVEIKENGLQISDKLIWMFDNESKSKEYVLNAHGYDPELWDLVSAISNMWHGMRPEDAGLRTLFQSKITVKPKTDSKFSLSDVDKFFEEFKYVSPKFKYEPMGYDENGVIVEINLADIHVGNEEFEKQNLTIEERVNYVIEDILLRVKHIKVKCFYLVQLGDICHYDTEGRTTTGGTRLTYNGDSNSKIFDRSALILINAIDKLKLVAPVEVISIYGNHDRIVSYTLSKAIEFYYRNDKYVMVDAGHNSRKYKKFGNNLVFWQHGDMSKKNLKSSLYKEARKEYGESLFAEIHCGNWHHQQVLEEDGMIIRYLPSLTSADEWHQLSGYTGAIMSVCSFVWDLKTGLRDIWFSNIPK